MAVLVDLKEDLKRYTRKPPGISTLILKALSNAGFRAMVFYRFGRAFKLRKMEFLAGLCQRFMHHLCHCWISVNADIGPGFLIAHVGGLVIGGKTRIGRDCDVRQNVTLGGNFSKKGPNGETQPFIEDRVSIAVGAAVLGPVRIGSDSIIGANSVVTRDVPPGMIVSGIPGKVIKPRWDESQKRSLSN